MTGFNHTLAGCLIAVVIPAPLAPIVAFLSHFVLDATPHFGRDVAFKPYNRNFIILLIFDGLLCITALGLSVWLYPQLWWLMIVCAATSTLPDFMWILRGKVKQLNGFFKFASHIQWGERPWGWMLEIIYAVIMTGLLFHLS